MITQALTPKIKHEQLGRLPNRHCQVSSCRMSERTRTSLHFIALEFEYPTNMFPRIVSTALFIPPLREASSNIDMQATSSSPQPNYRGPVELASYEVKWSDRQPFLESKGYMLRPRLRPGWTPSWLLTGQDYFTCEDSARLPVS
jgi:hypothetical protein